MRILWLELAESDLSEILEYFSARRATAALTLLDAIQEGVARLAEYPDLGRSGRVVGTRELMIGGPPYLVAYTVDPRIEAVIILRVLHGARLWPEDL